MENNVDKLVLGQELKMVDRKEILLSGIKKIVSFDNEEFLMESNLGMIMLKGSSLEIIKLDTKEGNVRIKGHINSITYIDENTKKDNEGFLSKLFK